jgi:hypothetical protein
MEKKRLFLLALGIVSLLLIYGCSKENTFFSEQPLVVQSANIFIPFGNAANGKTAIIVATTNEGATILIQVFDPSEKLMKLISSLKNGDKIHVQGSFETNGAWKYSGISEIVNETSGMVYKAP